MPDEKKPTKSPEAQRRSKQADRDIWDLAFLIEHRLEAEGVKLVEEYQEKDSDVRDFYLVQRHGPFSTRGEALQWAMANLAALNVER